MVGFDLLQDVFTQEFEDVTPEATRKIAIMECLLLAFVDHALDLSLIDKMEAELKDLVVGHRSAIM